MILALLMLLGSVANAQQLTLPLDQGQVNLSNFLANAHAFYALDQHRDKLAGGYIPAVSFETADGKSLVDLNIGAVWDRSAGPNFNNAGPFFGIGLRADNLLARAKTQPWIKSHVTTAPIPSVELGPFGGWSNALGWIYGGFVSARLGG